MKFFDKLRRGLNTAVSAPTATPVQTDFIDPVTPRVLLIIHDPIVKSNNGRRLHQVLRWHDPDQLVQQYIADLRQCSYGYLNYQIVDRIVVDGFPVKEDGFVYDTERYLTCWRARAGFHQPDRVDYGRILNQFHLLSLINQNQIDEVWLMAFPYAGYYESIMVGPSAFWCNAPPMARVSGCRRRFVVMGFNFERGVGEMLESFGHRVESIMTQVYRQQRGERNLWQRFIRYDKTDPGQAECGNVHFAPNSQRDYDWGNRRSVPSRCDTWLRFPDLDGRARKANCDEWGNGDIRQHHCWWLRHLPHVSGQTNGIANNWWQYIVDPNKVTS